MCSPECASLLTADSTFESFFFNGTVTFDESKSKAKLHSLFLVFTIFLLINLLLFDIIHKIVSKRTFIYVTAGPRKKIIYNTNMQI